MTTNLTPEQLNKLPKYVAQEIERLSGNVEYLRRKLQAGPEDSNAFLDPHSEEPRPLGKNPVIKFQSGDGEMDGFVVQFVDGELKIQGVAPRYDDYLGVFPVSGNYVTIKHVKKEG